MVNKLIKKASNKIILEHCQASISLSRQILPNDIIVSSYWKQLIAFSDERREGNEKGEGDAPSPAQRSGSTRGRAGVERRGKKSLLLYAPYIKENPDERLCVMFSREGLLKHEILKFF